MSIKIDLETATREELVAECLRQHDMNKNWADSWVTIVKANTQAWADHVRELEARVVMLEKLI